MGTTVISSKTINIVDTSGGSTIVVTKKMGTTVISSKTINII
jgi:hypothetical protein